MFVYCLNNPVQFLDSLGQFAAAYYDEARDRLNVFNDIGRGGGGHRGGNFSVGAAVASAATGVVIGTVAAVAASTPKEKEEAKTEAIATTKTADSNNAVFYGIDFYGGSMRYTTGSMTFSQADAWATIIASSGQYSSRAAWGLYTKDPSDALSMAIWLGIDPGVVRFDAPKTDKYLPHYHTADKSIHGIPAPSFHIWFG